MVVQVVQEREQAPCFLPFPSRLEKQHSDLDRPINFLARESGLPGVTQGQLWGVMAPISVLAHAFLAPIPHAPRRSTY